MEDIRHGSEARALMLEGLENRENQSYQSIFEHERLQPLGRCRRRDHGTKSAGPTCPALAVVDLSFPAPVREGRNVVIEQSFGAPKAAIYVTQHHPVRFVCWVSHGLS